MKPIKPDEVSAKKIEVINENMIKAVNDMIVMNWLNDSATFKQKDLVTHYFKVIGVNKTQKRVQKLYDDNQLDIEPLFESVGWDVYYDRPAYNETYEPTFTFTRKTKREQLPL